MAENFDPDAFANTPLFNSTIGYGGYAEDNKFFDHGNGFIDGYLEQEAIIGNAEIDEGKAEKICMCGCVTSKVMIKVLQDIMELDIKNQQKVLKAVWNTIKEHTETPVTNMEFDDIYTDDEDDEENKNYKLKSTSSKKANVSEVGDESENLIEIIGTVDFSDFESTVVKQSNSIENKIKVIQVEDILEKSLADEKDTKTKIPEYEKSSDSIESISMDASDFTEQKKKLKKLNSGDNLPEVSENSDDSSENSSGSDSDSDSDLDDNESEGITGNKEKKKGKKGKKDKKEKANKSKSSEKIKNMDDEFKDNDLNMKDYWEKNEFIQDTVNIDIIPYDKLTSDKAFLISDEEGVSKTQFAQSPLGNIKKGLAMSNVFNPSDNMLLNKNIDLESAVTVPLIPSSVLNM